MSFFRNHADEVRLTSPATAEYNCLAWALGVSNQSIWPDEDRINSWPESLPRNDRIDTILDFLLSLGFEEVDHGHREHGYTKIAVHLDNLEVAHVSRLTPQGWWESKLGALADVHHDHVHSLSDDYGSAYRYMRLSNAYWPPRLPPMIPAPARFISLTGGRIF
jgi:hypothetical protein